jgi:hypothetical protein
MFGMARLCRPFEAAADGGVEEMGSRGQGTGRRQVPGLP